MATSPSLMITDLHTTPSGSTRAAKLKQHISDSAIDFYAESTRSSNKKISLSNDNSDDYSNTSDFEENSKSDEDEQLKSKCLTFTSDIDNVNLHVS